ncbi:MAG: thiamine phosphate synthase [Sulfurimonadaceae bacterium]|nr:thiamine phosphate synthase [Sulfurimonadaceae bacterium]
MSTAQHPDSTLKPLRLYALCDQATLDRLDISLESFIGICKEKNAEIIQYRNKEASTETLKKRLIALRKLWDGFLIINDHYELVPFCDGVHIGQEDLEAIDPDSQKALKALKAAIGSDKIIGLSTHNEAEIEAANRLDLNYVGLGAYRPTGTKDVDHIIGDNLDAAAAKSVHPVAAIGGVTFEDSFEHVTYHVIGSGLFR